jgi:hypothetical protein
MENLINELSNMTVDNNATNIHNIVKTILTNIVFTDMASSEDILHFFKECNWHYEDIQCHDIIVGYKNIHHSGLNMFIVEQDIKYIEQYNSTIAYYEVHFVCNDPSYNYKHYFSITHYD